MRSENEVEHEGGAKSEPRGIGADVAGLPALKDCAEENCKGAKSPREAAEDCEVDDPLEEVLGEGEQGLDDGEAVELIDVVLVLKQVVSGGRGGCKLRGGRALAWKRE